MSGMNCIYCGKPVEPGVGTTNFCFTKKWSNKRQAWIREDWTHGKCYREEYDRIMRKLTPAWKPIGIEERPDRDSRQITIDEWIRDKNQMEVMK